MITWNATFPGRNVLDSREAIRQHTTSTTEGVIRRAKLLGCAVETERTPLGSVPANQSCVAVGWSMSTMR